MGAIGHVHNEHKSDELTYGMLSYFVVLGLWGLEVCRNMLHVTSCGALGQWYYNNNIMTTFPSLFKAATVQFGSICLGSLFVAIIEAVRMVMQWIKASDSEMVIVRW